MWKAVGKKIWPLLAAMALLLSACGGAGTGTSGGQTGEQSGADAAGGDASPIKIGVLASLTGALENYGKQTVRGFELGIEYATDGTNEVLGRPIDFIVEDTETKQEVAVQKATKLLEEDKVDFLVGSSSSADTVAVLPLAEEYQKIMIVEPAAADSITGAEWNRYIFRTARNSSQDAIAAAAAIAKEGVTIATLAQDYAYGRDGVSAFKAAAEELGAKIILEEYADPNATDVTAHIQKIIDTKPDYLYVVWAGANTPWTQLGDMKVMERGIKISTNVADFAALRTMWDVVGMEGFTLYHYTLPDNEVNDWLVKVHQERYGEPPDIFVPGGMTAALAIVEAIKKTDGNLDPEALIEAMEGMHFMTPKGMMSFRPEDHQALQAMYAVRLEKQEGVDYPVPVLVREMSPEETAPPIRNR